MTNTQTKLSVLRTLMVDAEMILEAADGELTQEINPILDQAIAPLANLAHEKLGFFDSVDDMLSALADDSINDTNI